MSALSIVAALVGAMGAIATALVGYYVGNRDSRRKELREAYTSWVDAVRATLDERAALVMYDHVESLTRTHPEAAKVTSSPAGRTRPEHVREVRAAETRLRDRETNLLLLEPSEGYVSTIRKLTELVMARPSSTGRDEYSRVFESIGIQKIVADGVLDLQERLRTDHPRLKRAG
jgi:hypothetical protein